MVIQNIKYFAQVDSSGVPTAFYADDIYDVIPPDAIEIPVDDWVAHNNDDLRRWNGKAWEPYIYQPSLPEAQATKIASLTADHQAAIDAGVAYQGATFQCDDASVAKLNAVLTAVSNGWALPAGFTWRDAANVDHPADAAFLQGLAQAMADNNAALFFRLQAAKDAVRSATTVADVDAVVF